MCWRVAALQQSAVPGGCALLKPGVLQCTLFLCTAGGRRTRSWSARHCACGQSLSIRGTQAYAAMPAAAAIPATPMSHSDPHSVLQVKAQEELLGRYRQQYGQMAGGARAGSPAAKPSPPVKVRVNDIESFISRQQQQQGRDGTAVPSGAEAPQQGAGAPGQQQEVEQEEEAEQEQLELRAGGSSPVPKEGPAAAAPQETLRLR
jgi:hypothetical protein